MHGRSPRRFWTLCICSALRLSPILAQATGYFSVRIAKRIPEGTIFAVDIEPDMVRYLGERARLEHLINLVPVQASADAANLPEPVDVVIESVTCLFSTHTS
jgi:ubiquinone/menaquinone biosynthesis C-methylase UbiE